MSRMTMAAAVALAACGSPGPDAAAPAPADVAPVPTGPQASDVAGGWVSNGCGDRAYPRLVAFADDGTYSTQEFVAPCPPGAQCVWSGIIITAGNWRLEGGRVSLEETEAGAAAVDAAGRPGELLLRETSPGDWTLVEAAGDAECPYERGAPRLGPPGGGVESGGAGE
jgi:hypothetical protein